LGVGACTFLAQKASFSYAILMAELNRLDEVFFAAKKRNFIAMDAAFSS
jgi:hypothetical protein